MLFLNSRLLPFHLVSPLPIIDICVAISRVIFMFCSTIKREIFSNNTIFGGFDFTERAPNAVELFANGPHHALEQFEVGDSNIGVETSFNFSG